MKARKQNQKDTGFSLIETLISLVVISLTLPIVFTTLSLGLSGKQRMRTEGKAIEIAQTIFSQIPFAWRDHSSSLFSSEERLPFPSLGKLEDGGALLDSNGRLYDTNQTLEVGDQDWFIPTPSMAQAVRNCYIVLVARSALPNQNQYSLQKVTVEVQYPSGRAEEYRQHHIYTRVFRNE